MPSLSTPIFVAATQGIPLDHLALVDSGAYTHSPTGVGDIYICILKKLLVDGLVSNQAKSRCLLKSSPLGYRQLLTQPQILGATENKKGCLGNHRIERQLKARARLSNKANLLMRPLLQIGRGGWLI